MEEQYQKKTRGGSSRRRKMRRSRSEARAEREIDEVEGATRGEEGARGRGEAGVACEGAGRGGMRRA